MGNSIAYNVLRSSLPLKRKTISRDSDDEDTDVQDISSPKRRKLTSTSKYIYKALFEEGSNSDVKIVALNHEWNLHKIYLSQSPYFNVMFNGPWVETTQQKVDIVIEDENITEKGLHKVLGSLYQDEIQIDPSEVVSILACGLLLQLDNLIQQCVEVMKENINFNTALQFYEAGELYGLNEIKDLSLEWLYHNMAVKIFSSPYHLAQVSCDLMVKLLSSFELVIMQTEFALYVALKFWVFLQENPSLNTSEATTTDPDNYFQANREDVPFLLRDVGKKYQKAFQALRLKYLLIHHKDLEIIEEDHIIPLDWFMPLIKLQWCQMLRIEQGVDLGPKEVSIEEFKRNCDRRGRIIKRNVEHCWRWTGFSFGIDIVMHYVNGLFHIQHFSKDSQDYLFPNSTQVLRVQSDKKRFIMYHIRVLSLDNNGKVLSKFETSIEKAALLGKQKRPVLNLPKTVKFPVLIMANFLLVTPLKSSHELTSNGELQE